MSVLSKLQDELATTRREQDQRGEKNILRQMGGLYAQEGDWKRWLSCEEQALPLARAKGSPTEVVEILCNLGAAYTDANLPLRAIEHLDEALLLARTNTLRRHEAAILGNLARAQSLTDFHQSLKTYDDALHIAIESGPHDELALLPGALWAAQHAQQNERAIIYAKQGIKAARKIQDRAAEGRFLLELGLLLIAQKAFNDASRCLKAARPLLHVTASREDLARCDAAIEQLPGPPRLPQTSPSLPQLPDEELATPSQRLVKNPRDVLALIGRAEAYLGNAEVEKALQDIAQAELIIQEEISQPESRMHAKILERLQALKTRGAALRDSAEAQ